MDGKTIRTLAEMIAEHHRKEKNREKIEYEHTYNQDTNGGEQDWEDDRED